MPVLVRRLHEGFGFAIGGTELIPDVALEIHPRQNGEPEEITVIRYHDPQTNEADVFLFGLDDLERFHAMIGARLTGVVVPIPGIVLPT